MPMTKFASRLACSVGIAALLTLSGPAGVFAKPTPEQKCIDAKAKAAGDAIYAATQCVAAAALAGTDIDPECFGKVQTKLVEGYVKADAKGTCAGVVDDFLMAAGPGCILPFAGALSGDGLCVSKKLKAMGTKAKNKVSCVRKVFAKGPAVGPACRAKLETKFENAIAKAEKKSSCTGTAAALEELVDACIGVLPLPHSCEDSLAPTCGGPCPDGTTCRPYEVFENGASVDAGCSCVDVTNGPECGEPVCATDQHCAEPDHVCEQWKTEGDDCDHTICQPAMTTPTTLPPAPENNTPCQGGDEFPTCGGTCPEGLRCQSVQGFAQDFTIFAGCLCVDPRGPRCAGAEGACDLSILPWSHCADPSQTCLVTLDPFGSEPVCTEAHCGPAVAFTTSTSVTTTTSTSSTTSTSTTTSTSSTTTTTLPCVSTPGISGNFEDLGNCTVLDHTTGLQWEQKQNVPGPHDVNNRYVWGGCCEDGCQTMCQPNAAAEATCIAMAEGGTDGCTDTCPTGGCYTGRSGAITTIFDWVNQLNAENFAGHNDWRVPSEAGLNPTGAHELMSILESPCTGDLCIDPIFGPTIQSGYWGRTANVSRPIEAWFVNFFDGGFGNSIKREAFFARAVRVADPD